MDRIRIRGGAPLRGEINISGAKNAALPLMAAGLLTGEPLVLTNVPALADIRTMARLLAQHGVAIPTEPEGDAETMTLSAPTITSTTAPYDLVRTMRASVLVLGPLLARVGEAEVSLPGGCAIGTRPVDLHLKGLEQMGAEITLERGYIRAKAPKGLKGARVVFPKVSVGATENLMMAASLAEGQTVLVNVAREPEVVDLGQCLQAMGARIEGLGTDTLTIDGVARLQGAHHAIVPDRIEAGSYALAVANTRGEATLRQIRPDHLEALFEVLRKAGVKVDVGERSADIQAIAGIEGVDVMTEPFPGFPTDLQAQFMALMTTATGASMVTETIFENRFMHVPELNRMGANINVHQSSAMVRGVPSLTGADVMATDLRASYSLVIAGLVAQGETTLHRVYHLDRGYSRLVRKLVACGADIERLKEPA